MCVCVCMSVCVKCLLGNVESRPLPPTHPVHKQHECNANTVTHPILHYASSPEVNTKRQVQPDPKAASNQPRSARNRRAQESTGQRRTEHRRAQHGRAQESRGESQVRPAQECQEEPGRARHRRAQESPGEHTEQRRAQERPEDPRRAERPQGSTGQRTHHV